VTRANIQGPLDRLRQRLGFCDTPVGGFTVNDRLPRDPDP